MSFSGGLLSCLLLIEHSDVAFVYWAYVASTVIYYLVCIPTMKTELRLWDCHMAE